MIGDNIKKFRLEKGLTQKALAEELNVVRQTVSKWEKNLSLPDADTLSKISETLGVSVNELLGVEEISREEESLSMEKVYRQLVELNQAVTKQNVFIEKLKAIIGVLVILVILVAIYPSWTEMWYEFGQNMYHWLH